MNLKKLSSRYFVSEQLRPSDLGLAAEQGIRTIICNRPDNEIVDQPDAQSIADAAAEHGIEFLDIPISPRGMTEEDVAEFATAYKTAEAPMLAYCRSGMRSTSLWALIEATQLDVDEIMATAMAAGFDLKGLRTHLETLAAK